MSIPEPVGASIFHAVIEPPRLGRNQGFPAIPVRTIAFVLSPRLVARSDWRQVVVPDPELTPLVVKPPASVLGVEFSRELRNDVLAGDITISVRLWKRPRVKHGGRYRVGAHRPHDLAHITFRC